MTKFLGTGVVTLIHSSEMDEGNYEVEFNASNLSSGVYFYRVTGTTIDDRNHFTSVKKMMLNK
ncbi:MAG: hypothetical protein FJ218_01930 [Ignavibacteria bacterium]|nr:hypothetical protein [Ignavibacteria bacterium]